MATGTPFVPAQFSTTIVAPSVATAQRTLPYISPSEYRFAPTAVGSSKLVSGSVQQNSDSLASLALVISRASSWVDTICLHRSGGDLQASLVVESMKTKIRPDYGFKLICNFKPVWEVTGLAIGATPRQLTNLGSTVPPDMWIEGKIIHVPASWTTAPVPISTYPADVNNELYAVWTYISGYPNFAVAGTAEIAAGTTILTMEPPRPGGTTLPAVYAGTQLTIIDGGQTETVVVASTPAGLSLTLSTPGTRYTHTIPADPDFLRVTALPQAIEQATIDLTSVLLKVQGSRAMVMPGSPGGIPTMQAMSLAGAFGDFQRAHKLLEPYEVVFMHD